MKLCHESRTKSKVEERDELNDALVDVKTDLGKLKLGKKVLSQRSIVVNSDLKGFRQREIKVIKYFLPRVRKKVELLLNKSLKIVRNIFFFILLRRFKFIKVVI